MTAHAITTRKGLGRIFKRKLKWWYDFTLDGVRYREPAGYTPKVAERALAKRIAEVEQGLRSPRSRRVRLKDEIPVFMEWSRASKASSDRDETSLGHVDRHLGKLLLTEIDHEVVETYRRERAKETTYRGGPPKPATLNREVAALKTLLSRAVKRKLLIANPLVGVGTLAENNERDRIVTPDELDRILAVGPAWLRPIAWCAYLTAMRRSEIVSLTRDQVDLQTGYAHIPSAGTKSRKPKAVPLNDEMIRIIKALPRPIRSDRIFTLRGKSVRPDSITQAFARAAEKAGVEDVTFHDLRHTACTEWYRAGVDASRIMKASGHATMAMFRRYTKITENELEVIKSVPRGSTSTQSAAQAQPKKRGRR